MKLSQRKATKLKLIFYINILMKYVRKKKNKINLLV